jgi:putative DNA primase/helicase
VPFEVTIPLEKRDPQLLQKLKAEAAGILAWIVRGSVDRTANGMQAPQCVVAATTAYRDESDPLADYVTERLVLGDEKRITRGEAWMDYESWEFQVGEKGSLKRDGFYARLRQLHNVKDSEWKFGRQKVRGFSGVGLKTA